MKNIGAPLTRRTLMGGAASSAVLPAQAPPRYNVGEKVRIGIVGGNFGSSFQWHLDPDCSVTAVCDIRPDRLKHMSEIYHCSNGYDDFRRMLRHPGMNAVGVFTPAPLHVEMAVAAMRAGKHVISAVPAGLGVEELELLLDTVKRTGLKYMMAETSYYRPEVITCMDWAREGRFGTIYYSESEYHHEGIAQYSFDEQGRRAWRFGYPPMFYPTHCTGFIIPVTGERLVEVTAVGYGDPKHPHLRDNDYKNPFWNETAFFKTSGGHCCRIAIAWHVAAGGTERGMFYGDRMSFIMARPEGSPTTVFQIARDGKLELDAHGYPQGTVTRVPYKQADHFERLPEPMRVKTWQANSHTFLTHEFVRAIVEDRHPTVDVWESIAYTLPGLIAHQSALNGGVSMKIRDYGKAPA